MYRYVFPVKCILILLYSFYFRFCARREWFYSCYILGLPDEFQTKSKVTLFQYTGPFKVNNIHSWIKDSISNKVENIEDWDTYSDKWIQYTTTTDPSEVRVVMYSKYQSIPLFYSSVSVKFPGRVKFGFIHTKSKGGEDISTRDPSIKPPSYLIVTKEYIFVYGRKFGEDLTFLSMETYLKTLYPCVNDIFVLSLIICNCLTLFEISLTQGTFLKRLMKFIWCIAKFNMCLLLIWISMLTLLQIPLMHNLTIISLKLLRLFRLSVLGTYLYKDYCFFSRQIMFTEFSFFIFIVLVGYIQYKRKENDEDEQTDEWDFTHFRTLEHLFSPTAGLFRTGIPAIDPERVHMRDIPTLRQICDVPDNYIGNLPNWRFKIDRTMNESEKVKNVEPLGNISDDLEQESVPKCECDCSSNLPTNTLNTQSCQNCKKLQKEYTGGPESCKHLPKKSSYLHNLKNSELVSTDQSDTDQEKDIIDEDHLYLENSQCVICLDEYTKGVWLCGLPCGHSFHQTCIHTWLNRDNHYCPVCRWTSYRPKPISVHLHSE